jgi:hypothetical protein
MGQTMLSSQQLPALGNNLFVADVTMGNPLGASYLFLSSLPAAVPTQLGAGCSIYLDLTSLLAFVGAGVSPIGPQITNGLGDAGFPLAIPANPGLAGTSIYLQALVIDPPSPLGFSLSNGLRCLLN